MYPLAVQSDYTELKYSLRSVEKFVSPKEVIIVGTNLPSWIDNVTQITVSDKSNKKQFNIRRKIMAALEYTEEILYLSDDVYVLRANNFPYYSIGNLKNNAGIGCKATHDQLKALKKPTINFNGHQPMIFDRRFKQIEVLSSDVLPKSAYCNLIGIKGVPSADCKVFGKAEKEQIKTKIKNMDFFSTAAAGLRWALPVLQELYPKKSIYEL